MLGDTPMPPTAPRKFLEPFGASAISPGQLFENMVYRIAIREAFESQALVQAPSAKKRFH